jgi:hypothetical protein
MSGTCSMPGREGRKREKNASALFFGKPEGKK